MIVDSLKVYFLEQLKEEPHFFTHVSRIRKCNFGKNRKIYFQTMLHAMLVTTLSDKMRLWIFFEILKNERKSTENMFVRVLATENLANAKFCHSNFTFEKTLPHFRKASCMVTDFNDLVKSCGSYLSISRSIIITDKIST